MGVDHFKNQMNQEGFYIFPDIINQSLVRRLIVDLEKSYSYCREVQINNGLSNTEGTCHHLLGQHDSFTELLSEYERIDVYLQEYFSGKYILNSLGGNLLNKGASYANNIHRDIRAFSGLFPLMINTIVMLDDFTEDNGATWLMKRGHIHEKIPQEKEFMDNAFQITARSGSIVVFNSNMWHRAGTNTTDFPRRSLTPEFTKPYIKQSFDYPRALGYNNITQYSLYLQEIFGYLSRTPETLNEWYQPENNRMYKRNQV